MESSDCGIEQTLAGLAADSSTAPKSGEWHSVGTAVEWPRRASMGTRGSGTFMMTAPHQRLLTTATRCGAWDSAWTAAGLRPAMTTGLPDYGARPTSTMLPHCYKDTCAAYQTSHSAPLVTGSRQA